MDIKMLEMDGYEAARIIRQRWPDNGPKIIAIIAFALEGDREKLPISDLDFKLRNVRDMVSIPSISRRSVGTGRLIPFACTPNYTTFNRPIETRAIGVVKYGD